MVKADIRNRITEMFPPEMEYSLLEEIGREVEATEEFQRLVRARKEYPELTIGESAVSVWVHGIPEENYDDPFRFSKKAENIFMEYIIPVSVEYAGFADFAVSNDCGSTDGFSRLTIAKNRYGLSLNEPNPIDVAEHTRLNELFDRLEEIGKLKIKECIRLFTASSD